MRLSRRARAVVALSIAAVAASSVLSGVASAQKTSQSTDPFQGVKRIKAPSKKACEADPGIDLQNKTITIGSVTPLTGPVAGFVGHKNGVDARVKKFNETNESGKGWKIIVKNEDDQYNGALTLPAYQKLVEQEKIFAAINATSFYLDNVGVYMEQQGIPVVGWQLGLNAYGKYKNMFAMHNGQVADTANQGNGRHSEMLKTLGVKKVALVSQTTPGGQLSAKSAQQAIENDPKGGQEVVYFNIDVPAGSTDMGAIAQAVKASGADGVYASMALASNAALARALTQAGANMKAVLFPSGYNNAALPLMANIPNLYINVEETPFEILNVSKPKGWTDFLNYYGQVAPGVAPDQFGETGWLAANTMITGLEASDPKWVCPTREAFLSNLRLVDGYTADGLHSPVNFRDNWNNLPQCLDFVTVTSTGFVPIFGGKQHCTSFKVDNGKVTKLKLPDYAWTSKDGSPTAPYQASSSGTASTTATTTAR